MCSLCRTFHLVRAISMCSSLLIIMPRRCVGCILWRQESPNTSLRILRPLLTRCYRHWIYIYGIFTLMVVRSWLRQMSLPFFTSQESLLHTHLVTLLRWTPSPSAGSVPSRRRCSAWCCAPHCLLRSGGLPWSVLHIYLLNRLPTKTVLGYMSPYECYATTQVWKP